MNKKVFITGAIFGLIAIILGAFAAHGLKPRLTSEAIATFGTGVEYNMYSALFLLFLGLAPLQERTKNICFYLTLFGVVFFSGSIYLLATNVLTNFDFTVIGFITPIGGTLMIAAWCLLLVNFIKLKKK